MHLLGSLLRWDKGVQAVEVEAYKAHQRHRDCSRKTWVVGVVGLSMAEAPSILVGMFLKL